MKKIIFWLYAAMIAPFHFKPKKCPYLFDQKDCAIWNCDYHYTDGKYSDCRKKYRP